MQGLQQILDKIIKIMHLHGDLRYKPFKKTQYNNPPYRWPVLVVGDSEVKKGIIALMRLFDSIINDFARHVRADQINENTSLRASASGGSACRIQDKTAVNNGIFDRIICYDIEDKFAEWCSRPYEWRNPRNIGLKDLLNSI